MFGVLLFLCLVMVSPSRSVLALRPVRAGSGPGGPEATEGPTGSTGRCGCGAHSSILVWSLEILSIMLSVVPLNNLFFCVNEEQQDRATVFYF